MFNFTKALSGLLIVGTAFFAACHSGDTVPREKLPADHLALQAGTSIQTSTGLNIRADSVRVSICPPNADCFAPDNASVLLHLSKASQSQSVRLFAWIPNYTRISTYPSKYTDSTSINFSGQRYKVILRDGRYNASSSSESSQEVIVQVSPID